MSTAIKTNLSPKSLAAKDAITQLRADHVKKEKDEMFPKVRASSLDLLELGARIAARKAELLAMRG